jgi:hypothetical protein
MRRFIRILFVGCLAIVLIVLGGGFYFYRSLQTVPEFYTQALAKPAAEPAKAAYKFEQQVLELRNDVRREGDWQATFSAEEINGWLANDLPVKFPKALPGNVSDPRVAISPEMIQVACKYSDARLSSVVSVGAKPEMTKEPNVIAIRVKQVRAGALPIPLANFLEQISQHSAKAGVPLRWGEEGGDPVAYITLPMDRPEFQGKTLRVEQVELKDGALVVSGKTEGG